MPFKTEHGTHYHMKEGCNGATIQCGTEGLTPCSICCGRGARDAHAGGPAGGIAGGSPSTGHGEHETDPGATSGTGGTTEMRYGTIVRWKPEYANGDADELYVLLEPTDGGQCYIRPLSWDAERLGSIVPSQATKIDYLEPAAGPDGETQDRNAVPSQGRRATEIQGSMANAIRSGFEISDIGTHKGSLPGGTGSPDMMDLTRIPPMGIDSILIDAPAPPLPRNFGEGVYIDVDGTVVREPDASDGDRGTRESTQRRASELVRRFDNGAVARWASPDYAAEAREALVGRIDGVADELPETRREEFRRTAQATWNTMHPEAPVLEWSRTDDGYVFDSDKAVVRRWRNYDEMRSLNGGSNAIGYDYGVFDKATGKEVTRELHGRDVAVRQVERRIADIEHDAASRAQREIVTQRNGLYREWLEGKRKESTLFKYHGGSLSWDSRVRDELWGEFVSDTGYEAPEPSIRHTEEEREELSRLYERQREAKRSLDESLLAYGVDEDVLKMIAPQFRQRRM